MQVDLYKYTYNQLAFYETEVGTEIGHVQHANMMIQCKLIGVQYNMLDDAAAC